jgi:drug/metabolite transporter (DMT)-like permease
MVASTAVLAIKASAINPILLASLRLLVAAVSLTPLYLGASRNAKRSGRDMLWEAFPSILPGLLLALHIISWNYGARMTWAANASLIVNMMPVAMPFIMLGLHRILIRRTELLGTLLALAGVLILSGGSVRFESTTRLGDLICFISMILFTLYIALGKGQNRQPSIWLYVVPLYWVAGLTALGISLPLVLTHGIWVNAGPSDLFGLLKELSLPLYLGIFPTIMGHTIFNRSMRFLSSQVVSIGMLSQFIFAGFFAFILFGEIPSAVFYPSAVLVILGSLVVILWGRDSKG